MILKEAPKITAMLVSLIAGKAAIITALSLAFGMSFANSQLSGLLLAQGGIEALCVVCCRGLPLCTAQCDLSVSV
jgi:Kef-type K+ transport system membrane component KefB